MPRPSQRTPGTQTDEGLFAFMQQYPGAEPDPVVVTKIENDRVTAHRADPETMAIIRHASGGPLYSYHGVSANKLII